jgi:hypothetical protein
MTKKTCRHGLRAFERNGHVIHAHDGSPCLASRPAPRLGPTEPPPFVTPAAPPRMPLAYETALPATPPSAPPPEARRAPHRHRVWPVVGGLIGALLLLGVGVGAGVLARNGAVDEQESRAVAAERRAASLQEALRGTAATIDEQQGRISRYEQQQAELRERERRLEQERDAVPPGANATTFGDGLYQAGVAIQPGQYRTDGTDACYWAKLSTGDTNSVVDNDYTTGPQTVTIDSPYFESENCGTWAKIG